MFDGKPATKCHMYGDTPVLEDPIHRDAANGYDSHTAFRDTGIIVKHPI